MTFSQHDLWLTYLSVALWVGGVIMFVLEFYLYVENKKRISTIGYPTQEGGLIRVNPTIKNHFEKQGRIIIVFQMILLFMSIAIQGILLYLTYVSKIPSYTKLYESPLFYVDIIIFLLMILFIIYQSIYNYYDNIIKKPYDPIIPIQTPASNK